MKHDTMGLAAAIEDLRQRMTDGHEGTLQRLHALDAALLERDREAMAALQRLIEKHDGRRADIVRALADFAARIEPAPAERDAAEALPYAPGDWRTAIGNAVAGDLH